MDKESLKIGFIGVGFMGYGMALNLINKNFDLTIVAHKKRENIDKKCKIKGITNNGVLVKYPKKKQDLRVDLPTIGLKTLKQCKSSGLKGVVLKSKQNIFLGRKKCINFANRNKMFITAR